MEDIAELEREYVFGTWSYQDAFDPKVVVEGDGNWFVDEDGNRYLDFSAQSMCSNVGLSHDAITEAIAEQLDRLPYASPKFTTAPRARLGERLAEVTPGDLSKSFFSTSGTEANEGAIKIARWFTGREKVVSLYRSYHGSTYGSISLSGDVRRWASEPGITGVVRAPEPYCYRCPLGEEYPDCGVGCAEYLEHVVEQEGGSDHVAAVIMEPIIGSNGVLYPPEEYLPRVREICDEHDLLLIFDEIMTGFGRTGEWFACEHWDVTPDVITLAKGLTGAHVPLGATVVSEEIAGSFEDRKFAHGHTYSGHAGACAAANATIDLLEEEGLVDRARELGAHLGEKLREVGDRHPSVGDVRGIGLFWGVELVADPETEEPFLEVDAYYEKDARSPLDEMAKAAMERGVFINPRFNTVKVAPPLTITRSEIDRFVEVFDEVLSIPDAEAETAE